MNKDKVESDDSLASLPLHIQFFSKGQDTSFCDDVLSLVYACIGKVSLEASGSVHLLKEDAVFLSERMIPVRLTNIEGTILLVQMDSVYFDQYLPGFSSMHFKSSLIRDNEEPLKYLLASILHSMESRSAESRLKIERDLMDLALYLKDSCQDEEAVFSDGHEDYVKQAIRWIHGHLNERMSASMIASAVGLSKEYLSRLFSRAAGMTLSDYIAGERLNESLRMLRYGHQNISEIAMACGFPNYKSYYAAFNTHFGVTPSVYRKKFQKEIYDEQRGAEADALRHLYAHLDNADPRIPEPMEQEICETDLNHNEGQLNKIWQKMMGFSNVYTAMGEDMRNQIRMVQKEIPFQYIRFHGIFSDDMKIIRRDEQGNVWYDFSRNDQLIDFFMANHLRPYVELGYMPSALASRKDYTFAWKANVSLPKDLEEWKDLVAAWLKNEIERWGIKEVRTWYFEIWNSFGFPFSTTVYSEQEKLSFLKATWKTVKGVDEHLRLGVIDTYLILADYNDNEMLENDFKFFQRNHIHPDFLSFSLYMTIFKDMNYHKIMENTQLLENGIFSPQRVFSQENKTIYAEKDFTEQRLKALHRWLDEHTDFHGELILNEWNLTPDSKDKLNDTVFKAPFFIYNVLHCRKETDALIYWTFSDIFEEVDYREEGQPFHGGIGFITNSGLKKPVWYALEFLNKLGDTVLSETDDTIVTRTADGSLQILLYHYCDFGIQGRRAEYTEKGDRYAVFAEKKKRIVLQLNGIFGQYTKSVYTLNRNHGSVYDQWEHSGAVTNVSSEMREYLRSSSVCLFRQDEISCNGNATIDCIMEPHEVDLIILKHG